MITIMYMYCSKELSDYNDICGYLDKSCPGIEICICIPNIVASWQELALAFMNTVDSIKNRRNIARKPELEFYIRFFANRQIHTILNNYLTEYKSYANFRTILISHDDKSQSCIETHINEFLANNPYCRYLPRPKNVDLHKLYLKLIENSIGSNLDVHIDKAHKIVIGIIGCGTLLVKD